MKEYHDMKEEIKNSNDRWKFKLCIKLFYFIVKSVEKIVKTKNIKIKTKDGIMLLSKCAQFDIKKSKFIKVQEARGLMSKLRGTKVPILSDLTIENILL